MNTWELEQRAVRWLGYFCTILAVLLVFTFIDDGYLVPQSRAVHTAALQIAYNADSYVRKFVPGFRVLKPLLLSKPKAKRHYSRYINSIPTYIDSSRDFEGWYVFYPPGDAFHKFPDPIAPFKRWAQGESFDSAQACEEYRERMLRKIQKDRERSEEPTFAFDYKIKLFTYADCVSSHDRRIAEGR